MGGGSPNTKKKGPGVRPDPEVQLALLGDQHMRFMDEHRRLVVPAVRPNDPIRIGASGHAGEVASLAPFGFIFLVTFAGDHDIAGFVIGVAIISASVGIGAFEVSFDLANERETPRLRMEIMGFMGFDETIEIRSDGKHGSLLERGPQATGTAGRWMGWVSEGSTGAARRDAPPVPQEAAIPACAGPSMWHSYR